MVFVPCLDVLRIHTIYISGQLTVFGIPFIVISVDMTPGGIHSEFRVHVINSNENLRARNC